MSIFNGSDELLIATSNKKKLAEMSKILVNFGIKTYYLDDFKAISAPSERANTFRDNAVNKAVYYNAHAKIPTVVDDSGLCINILNGFPGVLSARFAKNCGNYKNALARIKQKLENTHNHDYSAYFICAIAVCITPDEIKIFEGRINGKIVFPPRGTHGFGYDSIFQPDNMSKTFAEITSAEKNKISHRALAINNMVAYFSSL